MMVTDKQVSVRQACKLVGMPRSVFRYRKIPKDDGVMVDALEGLVKKHPTIGFWKCYYRLRESRLKKYDLVICDEPGYISFDKQGAEMLFNHLSLRSGIKSPIITTISILTNGRTSSARIPF